MDILQKDQKNIEIEFWSTQTKDKYANYEKKVYSAFREREYIEIINKGLIGCYRKRNAKVLDIGCGAGVSSIVLSNMGFDVVGIDISSNLISQAVGLSEDSAISWLTLSGRIEKKPKFIIGDVAMLAIEGESIDICFLSGVLHHFPNYEIVLEEVQRVLKKDGILVACEPNLFNLPYRLSYYLVNRKKGVSRNDFPLSSLSVEKDLKIYFRNIRLYQFREKDVPFLRQLGWFGRSIFGKFMEVIILSLKNTFASEYTRGTFFIVSCQK
jgi:ubiquinone/menaquinone biosynthesis C-methylase UbiE